MSLKVNRVESYTKYIDEALENGISKEELDDMHHAYHRAMKNSCYSSSTNKVLNGLVDKGLMRKLRGWDEEYNYYQLTEKGIELLTKIQEQDNE